MGAENLLAVASRAELEGWGYHVTESREGDHGNWRVVAVRQSFPSLQADRIEVSTRTRALAWEAVLGAARAFES